MRTFLSILSLVVLSGLVPTKVLAASEYEELTYDDLVSQLSEKHDQATQKKAQPQSVHSHLGLGISNTWSEVSSQGHTFRPGMNGFELTSGMDLNSELLRGQVGFRNFFERDTGTQTSSLHELDAGLQIRRPVSATWDSTFTGGFAIRMLRFKDSATGVDVDDTSSMLMASGGLETRLSPSVAFGGEISTRVPFGTPTADRNSIDLGLKLDTTF